MRSPERSSEGPTSVVAELSGWGVERGDLVGLAVAPGVGVGMATVGETIWRGTDDPSAVIRLVEEVIRPRWVLWSNDTVAPLIEAGVRIATCWDVAAVHRLLFGGWSVDPARSWAQANGLDVDMIPTGAPPNLFSLSEDNGSDLEDPVRPDGHLKADWVAGEWATTPLRLGRWAALALRAARLQERHLADRPDGPRALSTVRSESAAELVCAEMSFDGLPIDRNVAETLIASFIGPRPRHEAEAAAQRAERDALVLQHAPADEVVDLRSPGQVKSLLARAGIDVPDTRASRLNPLRDDHPIVEAILRWRKAERIATTYGYAWLDEHVGADGRLRGAWSGSDGAAGRMTASGGLHNMPADMRPAVVAEPGHVFARADLGQIEPRVLAAVSRDPALAGASIDDDMYLPVAAQLGVDRATAKVAVLGAMYGQTTGHGARALRRLEATYPVAMAYLDAADRSGQVSRDLRTYGGRLIRMGSSNISGMSERDARSRAAARGRYGRNALVQGAAAELFKVWAVTVRARIKPLGATIVLCLHDELLVHAPTEHGDAVAVLLDDCLQEAAHRWAPDGSVRFVADVTVISRWADAKS
jgi:DNA polymerase-1